MSSHAERGRPTERALTWLDVFTSTPLAGNQLAVVHDADGLDDATMLAFARETKLSETTFVQSGDEECDYRNRIWMRTGELPMAGHPSLGTAVAIAHRRGEARASYVQRTPAGLQPVVVELDGRIARSSMLQEPEQQIGPFDAARALAAIGLTPEDAHDALPVEIVSTGARQLLVPLRDADALARATPDPRPLAEIIAETGVIVAYPFVADGESADARSFFDSPGGIAEEDPATGSAAGPLMAYMHRHAGIDALTIVQGVQMGRPSRLDCAVEGDRVRVGGEVVVLSEGTIWL
jgi:trans-2,3-dihydro-3-hydroxyanthranilate isomerase